MPLKEYLRILWKRGWIIIVMVTLTAASALVFSMVQQPVYRSTIQLNVMPVRPDFGLGQLIKILMRNYAANILSYSSLSEVANRAGQDMEPDDLRKRIRVSSIEADYMIQIDVDDYDPRVAQLLAQTTAEVFIERNRVAMLEIDKRDRVVVDMKDPAPVGHLHSPNWKINLLAGGIFGLVLGGLMVLGLEWVDSGVIRSAEDLERAANVAVVGAVPEQ